MVGRAGWEEMGEIVDFSLRGMAWRDVAFS
jgi:hypothetical protein